MIQEIILGFVLSRFENLVVRKVCVADAEDLILEWEMPGYKYPFHPKAFSRQVL